MDSALEIVELALSQSRPSGLSEALRAMAQAVRADGCILWESKAQARVDEAGTLFVLAQSFSQAHACAVHDLPLRSVTGDAIRSGKTQQVPDIDGDSRVQKTDDFFVRTSIASFFAVPVAISDDAPGALNFYYRRRSAFLAEDIREGERLARLVTPLYRATMDRMTRKLLVKLNETLRAADEGHTRRAHAKGAKLPALDAICTAIAETFECLEASIFLTDPLADPGEYRLKATTWRRRNMPRSWRAKEGEGLTAWVLRHKRPLLIPNLRRFAHDHEAIQRQYPGLAWNRLESLNADVARAFGSRAGGLPVLTFMAAPILWGNQVLGAVRCALTTRAGFLSTRESHILALVAGELGRWWASRVSHQQLDEEIRSWRNLVVGLGQLNRFVHAELNGTDAPNEASVLKRALEETAQIVPDAQIMDVRLVDEECQELYFAETLGREWDGVGARRHERFPLDGRSAGANVVRTGKTYVMRDVTRDARYSMIFPAAKRMIIAPLGLDQPFGVIDLRGTGPRDFPHYAVTVAELLGQQVGLYHNLIETMRRRRAAEQHTEREALATVQAAQDLAHQLKGPILQAYLRSQSALESLPHEDASAGLSAAAVAALRQRLYAIRGLCGKAKRVTLRTALYAAFASGAPITLSPRPADDVALAKLLVEASRDNARVAAERDIRFVVDVDAIRDNHRLAGFAIDYDLMEQAVNNLLDNAGKYSYEHAIVHVTCGFTRGERLAITVSNKGIPLSREDARHCLERGWRGVQAGWVTGEGTGIGLWVVDNIMRAVAGEVIITPTENDVTEFKLVFPPSKGQPA